MKFIETYKIINLNSVKAIFMKTCIVSLVLIFSLQSLAKADDISDFQIEGMSIGDSLLDYYSKEQIQSAYQNASYYRDKIFAIIFVKKDSINYNRIQVTLKPDDQNYEIFSLEGIIDFDKKIDECNKQKKKIIQDLEQEFSNFIRDDADKPYDADPSGDSFIYASWFFLNSGGYFSVSCTKMGNEVRKKNGWTDELSVAVTSKELENFLRGNPY